MFETKTGELIHVVLVNPTTYIEKLELEKTKDGALLVPFSAVIAVGDFVVLAEEDIFIDTGKRTSLLTICVAAFLNLLYTTSTLL